MNIDQKFFEQAIESNCIQLTQAVAVTSKCTMEAAKGLVANFLRDLTTKYLPQPENDPAKTFKMRVCNAIASADGDPAKAYFELLKLREGLD